MKSIISLVCLLVVVAALGQQQVEARPKRSIIYAAAPAVAVASVPVVRTAAVVHASPATSSVVKTEQHHDGVQSSYSYSTEVKSGPAAVVHSAPAVVHSAPVVAAAPAAAVASVSTVHHTVPAYSYSYYQPASYAYYSPYHYIVGK